MKSKHTPWSLNEKRPCNLCKELCLASDFAKEKRNNDGLRYHCRKCRNAYSYKSLRLHSLERYAKQKKWREQQPIMYRANTKVGNDVRLGKLTKSPCIVCKKLFKREREAQAHHCDYTKSTEVTWLCPSHHKAWHRVFIPEGKK